MNQPSLKNSLRHALEANDLGMVVSLAKKDKKALSALIRLSYDKDTLTGRRAIEAVGLISREFVKRAPQFLREQIRKLLWSLNDESGGIGWAAPELIGEIISADPDMFRDLIPPLTAAFDAEEGIFRPGVVYALARIAERSPELSALHQRVIISSLLDKEPMTRIYGLWLLSIIWDRVREGGLWTEEYMARIKGVVTELEADKSEAVVFQNGNFRVIMVDQEAKRLSKKFMSSQKRQLITQSRKDLE